MAGDFGEALRERRAAIDLSRSRLAAAAGVTVAIVGRWERGEARPTPAQFAALAEILSLSAAEIEIWRSLLQPSRAAGVSGPAHPPAAVPPPPVEAASVVRRLPPPPKAAAPDAPRRPVPVPDEERAGRERRRFEGLLSRGNTGAIFPIPARPGRVYTYGDGPPTYDEDRWRYRARTVMLIVVLGILAGLLAWAIGELAEGLAAIVDLFRSEPAQGVVDALAGLPFP